MGGFCRINTRGKSNYSEKELSHRHFVHHKSHTDGPGNEPGCLGLETGDQRPSFFPDCICGCISVFNDYRTCIAYSCAVTSVDCPVSLVLTEGPSQAEIFAR